MESPAIDARRCEGMGGNAAGCCTGAVLVVLVVLIELVVLIVLVVFGGLEAVFSHGYHIGMVRSIPTYKICLYFCSSICLLFCILANCCPV